MMIFDFILLLAVSVLLAVKSLYLGSVTLVLGLLISFQSTRTQFLLGKAASTATLGRKIKAATLSIIVAACMYPFIAENNSAVAYFDTNFNSVSVLPIVLMIGLFSATMMAAIAVEKRKR